MRQSQLPSKHIEPSAYPTSLSQRRDRNLRLKADPLGVYGTRDNASTKRSMVRTSTVTTPLTIEYWWGRFLHQNSHASSRTTRRSALPLKSVQSQSHMQKILFHGLRIWDQCKSPICFSFTQTCEQERLLFVVKGAVVQPKRAFDHLGMYPFVH